MCSAGCRRGCCRSSRPAAWSGTLQDRPHPRRGARSGRVVRRGRRRARTRDRTVSRPSRPDIVSGPRKRICLSRSRLSILLRSRAREARKTNKTHHRDTQPRSCMEARSRTEAPRHRVDLEDECLAPYPSPGFSTSVLPPCLRASVVNPFFGTAKPRADHPSIAMIAAGGGDAVVAAVAEELRRVLERAPVSRRSIHAPAGTPASIRCSRTAPPSDRRGPCRPAASGRGRTPNNSTNASATSGPTSNAAGPMRGPIAATAASVQRGLFHSFPPTPRRRRRSPRAHPAWTAASRPSPLDSRTGTQSAT